MTMFPGVLHRFAREIESYVESSSAAGVVLVDPALVILDANRGFARLFRFSKKPAGAPLSDFLELDGNPLERPGLHKILCNRQTGTDGMLHCQVVPVDGGGLLFCERLMLTEGHAIEQMTLLNNELVNLQRDSVKKNRLLEKLKSELDERVAQLEETLARVKQLEGIIPICSYCRKIRDDQNAWHLLEEYIGKHTDAKLSHGVCPDCFARQMREMGLQE